MKKSEKKRSFDGSGHDPGSNKKYKSESSSVKVGDKASITMLRQFDQYLRVEAGKDDAQHHLKPFEYEVMEAEALAKASCSINTVNPYVESCRKEDGELDAIKLAAVQSKVVEFATKLSQSQVKVKKEFEELHIARQSKLVAKVIECMTGTMKEVVMRWIDARVTELKNPYFHGVVELVQFIYQQSGASSTDLYASSRKELFAMEWNDTGNFDVQMYFERLQSKIEEVNNQANTEAERLTSRSALLSLIWNAFGKSTLLAAKISEYRTAVKQLESDMMDLDPTVKCMEDFESKYILQVDQYTHVRPHVDFNTTLNKNLSLAGGSVASPLSSRSSLASSRAGGDRYHQRQADSQ